MRMSVELMRVAIGVQSYHAHGCRILVRGFAVEFLNSALADLPSHVACHVGMRVRMCESLGPFREYVTFGKRRKERAEGWIL